MTEPSAPPAAPVARTDVREDAGPAPDLCRCLNAIAVEAGREAKLLRTWRKRSANRSLQERLEALELEARERSASFARQVRRLGGALEDRYSDGFEERLAIASSSRSDADKLARLFDLSGTAEHGLEALFDLPAIDPCSGALLGRYFAERRQRLAGFEQLQERLTPAAGGTPDHAQTAEDEVVLQAVADRLARLERTVHALKALRG